MGRDVSRSILNEIIRGMDFSELYNPSKESARIVSYGKYMDMDNFLHDLTGMYIDDVLDKLTLGWKFVPPEFTIKYPDTIDRLTKEMFKDDR